MFALSRRRITQALSAAVLVAVAGIATADTGSPGKSIRVGLHSAPLADESGVR